MTNILSMVRAELGPGGNLRAGLNYSNFVLVKKDPISGEPRGIAVELAREIARRLDIPLEFVPFETAGRMADAVKSGAIGEVRLIRTSFCYHTTRLQDQNIRFRADLAGGLGEGAAVEARALEDRVDRAGVEDAPRGGAPTELGVDRVEAGHVEERG